LCLGGEAPLLQFERAGNFPVMCYGKCVSIGSLDIRVCSVGAEGVFVVLGERNFSGGWCLGYNQGGRKGLGEEKKKEKGAKGSY